MRSPVLPPCPIQHVTKLTTKHWCSPRISGVWAIVARIWFPTITLWWTSNVPPSAFHRTWAAISRHTSTSSGTTSKQSSHLADILLLYRTPITSWRTWETPHEPPYEMISAHCGSAEDWCCRDCEFASITWVFLWRIERRVWERRLVGLGPGQMQSPNQLEANGMPLEAICQKHGAAQLECLQQMEKSMGGWVCWEAALVHYPGT